MKIIILHGDDTIKLYDRLQKFIVVAKHRSWKITEYSLEEIENQSLFNDENFYILKDYKLLEKKDIEKLKNYSGNLIIYYEGKIPAPVLKTFEATKVELFELPQLMWKFLDNMTVQGLHELIKTQPVESLIGLIAWKLKQKYQRYPTTEVTQMISELAEIDYKSKIGKADLLLSLDLLLSKNRI